MVSDSVKSFGIVDYVIFGLMLAISGVIGVFFAWRYNRRMSTTDYLLANRSISWFPIFVSLVASFFSAAGVMGIPAQVYTTGITFALQGIGFIVMISFSMVVFVPVFRHLDITSVNEYLELRYSVGVRYLGCILYHVQYLLYMSIVLYMPSLALESVAGVPMYATIISTGVVCTFYTTIGGIRAVLWTDVFQSAVMMFGLIFTAALGVHEVGGFDHVMSICKKWGRLDVEMSPDPRTHHSLWGNLIGVTFSVAPVWTIGQPTVQRMLTAKSTTHARVALLAAVFGLLVIFVVLSIDALVIFALYVDCDLRIDKRIKQYDQIIPYFVQDKLGHMSGVPGLFTASLFSFALSTISSGLNGVSALLLEDVIKKKWPFMSDLNATRVSKLVSLLGGLFVTGFAFVIPHIGKLAMQLVISLFGIIGGPYMSIFIMGMFTKFSNKWGAYSGAICGVAISGFLSAGQFVYPPDKQLLPVPVHRCTGFNATLHNMTGVMTYPPVSHDSQFAQVFSISYQWFGFISVLTSLLVGFAVSGIVNCCKGYHDHVDSDLLYSCSNSWLGRKVHARKKESSSFQLMDQLRYSDRNPVLSNTSPV